MGLNMNDASVALRSFARRYGEVVNGPVGDDGWERRVRAAQPKNASAAAQVVFATNYLRALTKALVAMPTTKEPALTGPTMSEPSSTADLKALMQELKAAGSSAAEALDARSHDDFDRKLNVDGKLVEVRTAVETVVNRCVSGIKLAEQAIEDAR